MTIFTVTKLEKMQRNSFWFDADRRANPDSLGKKRGFAAGRNHLQPKIWRSSHSFDRVAEIHDRPGRVSVHVFFGSGNVVFTIPSVR